MKHKNLEHTNAKQNDLHMAALIVDLTQYKITSVVELLDSAQSKLQLKNPYVYSLMSLFTELILSQHAAVRTQGALQITDCCMNPK